MVKGGQARPVPGKTTLLKDIQLLATLDSSLGDISDAAIFVDGNVIKWVGPTQDVPKDFASASEVICLPDRVVIPGLVNTHHHMFQCLTRCIAQVLLCTATLDRTQYICVQSPNVCMMLGSTTREVHVHAHVQVHVHVHVHVHS